MCGLILAILVVPKKITPVISTWHSDLSGLPFSKRRAYGRILETPFTCSNATIKRLKPIATRDSEGNITDRSQVYALTLSSNSRATAILYFTRQTGQSIERLDYRRRPSEVIQKGSVPVGITSVQFMAPDPKSGRMITQIYRHSFSARIFLGSQTSGRVSGSLITVFPDSRRSFVSGSFKAQLISNDPE